MINKNSIETITTSNDYMYNIILEKTLYWLVWSLKNKPNEREREENVVCLSVGTSNLREREREKAWFFTQTLIMVVHSVIHILLLPPVGFKTLPSSVHCNELSLSPLGSKAQGPNPSSPPFFYIFIQFHFPSFYSYTLHYATTSIGFRLFKFHTFFIQQQPVNILVSYFLIIIITVFLLNFYRFSSWGLVPLLILIRVLYVLQYVSRSSP